MHNRRNLYRILHVQADAPAAVIKSSYRTMMQKLRHHPDLGGDVGSATLLNEAIRVLGDPVLRAAYDEASASTKTTRKPPSDKPDKHSSACSKNETSVNSSTEKSNTKRPVSAGLSVVTAPTQQSEISSCLFCRTRYSEQDEGQGRSAYSCAPVCYRCGGAMMLVSTIESDLATETRKIFRLDHVLEAMLWDRWPLGKPAYASVIDLSIYGCAITCVEPQTQGTRILLKAKSLNSIGEIRHCDREYNTALYRIGIAFLTLHFSSTPGNLYSITA